ncbi:GNAT family N-acetyltransferase [Actinoplanes flavus]|uniref:GNAT family N-acetyltransferase n=1 Tax=Actinoplanes flavus TaxID=2820290 RepID=A0ABS3UCS7_9ACTN|nr:GNAT family N-acetyltransferase [Actinoplanes flavus]MBO3736256.1 GNAT family N-acetyltransferase [Actinoplanes flavus]
MQDIKIKSAGFGDPAVQTLVAENLRDLSDRYGGSGDDTPITAADFTPPNGDFLVAVENDRLIASAGWRRHGDDAELKRMFTTSAARGRGVARRMLAAVEASAAAAGCKRMILETGDRQPEAIALYESAGYVRIPDFGYYAGYPDVLSYAKPL